MSWASFAESAAIMRADRSIEGRRDTRKEIATRGTGFHSLAETALRPFARVGCFARKTFEQDAPEREGIGAGTGSAAPIICSGDM